MNQISFEELRTKWTALCDKFFESPQKQQEKKGLDEKCVLITLSKDALARLNKEWSTIRTLSGWTGKQEMEAYHSLSVHQKQTFSSMATQGRSGNLDRA